jgi:signal transduction histidine kinase
LTFDCIGDSPRLKFGVPNVPANRCIYCLLKEALINIEKHSQATLIRLDLLLSQLNFRDRISAALWAQRNL